MELLSEDDPIVIEATRRFDEAWAVLVEKATPRLDPEITPVLGMWDTLEIVAETDDERLIASMFAYNVDDPEMSVGVVEDRVRVLYEVLARLELDPVLLKQKLNNQ